MRILLLTTLCLCLVSPLLHAQQEGAAGNITASTEFQAVQATILSNPQIMNDIQKLIQDPELMALIADPDFIALVQSGRTDAISRDPRLKKLSENPNVQALVDKIKSRQ